MPQAWPDAGAELVDGAAAGALDLHEGIVDPLASGCRRWPEHLRLLNRCTGELVPGRCRATNLCRYCQTLYVVETLEMLTLDAVENAPTIWVVLTAREHLTRAELRRHLEQLRKSLRKRWLDVQWFVQVEFQRRGALHANLLVKGVPLHDLEELRAHAVELWCSRVDALPVGQWVGAIEDAGGVTRYLQKTLAHGLKQEQAPPIGWRGHRTSQTRGYLVRPASVMREEARRAIRLKRKLHAGVELQAAELELAIEELEEWELRHVQPSTIELRPARRSSGMALRDDGEGEPRMTGHGPLPGTGFPPEGQQRYPNRRGGDELPAASDRRGAVEREHAQQGGFRDHPALRGSRAGSGGRASPARVSPAPARPAHESGQAITRGECSEGLRAAPTSSALRSKVGNGP